MRAVFTKASGTEGYARIRTNPCHSQSLAPRVLVSTWTLMDELSRKVYGLESGQRAAGRGA